MYKKTSIIVMHKEGNSKRKIAKSLNISRNTVDRVINQIGIEYTPKKYQRQSQHYPKLKNYIPQLSDMLKYDLTLEVKSRCNAKNYYNRLCEIGFNGSYDSVRRYVKKWKNDNAPKLNKSYIPLAFEPGEAYQFDWSHEIVILAGKVTPIKVAHFRLCYSRAFFVVAYLRESQEMLFDAHDKAFEFFDGIPQRGIYDNMKTAVDQVFVNQGERRFNEHFLCIMKHYKIEPHACNPASGWEKGQVEKQVDNIRDWIFRPQLSFGNMDELNAYLKKRCLALFQEHRHPEIKEATIEEIFKKERGMLRPFTVPFGGYKEECRVVDSVCMVNYDSNKYSVYCTYTNKRVDLRAYANKIAVFCCGVKIAEHPRCFDRNKKILNPMHYIGLLERKPGAIRNGLPFKKEHLPESIAKIREILMARDGGDKELVNILIAAKNYSLEELEVACELAISDQIINEKYILNALTRLSCKEESTIKVDSSIKLKDPPRADCDRYNELLGVSYDPA